MTSTGPCMGCPEDFTCDDQVTVEDLLVLLAEWGPCGGQESAGLGMSLESALGALGFESTESFKTWAKTASISDVHAMGELMHIFISPESGGGDQ